MLVNSDCVNVKDYPAAGDGLISGSPYWSSSGIRGDLTKVSPAALRPVYRRVRMFARRAFLNSRESPRKTKIGAGSVSNLLVRSLENRRVNTNRSTEGEN